MSDLFANETVNWADAPIEEVKKEQPKKKEKKVQAKKTKMEVILNTEVKDWASDNAPTIANLSRGDIVSVGKEDGDFIEVRITKAVTGFVKKKYLK